MAANPIAVVHDGMVEIPIELKYDPRFRNGAKLQLVPVPVSEQPPQEPRGDWRRLEGILSRPDWTPEEHTRVVERKRKAQEELDRVYASGNAGATAMKAAEREWELADDELDFGPFRAA
jgi:hypothetical protein